MNSRSAIKKIIKLRQLIPTGGESHKIMVAAIVEMARGQAPRIKSVRGRLSLDPVTNPSRFDVRHV
jgi:hypothetical protein